MLTCLSLPSGSVPSQHPAEITRPSKLSHSQCSCSTPGYAHCFLRIRGPKAMGGADYTDMVDFSPCYRLTITATESTLRRSERLQMRTSLEGREKNGLYALKCAGLHCVTQQSQARNFSESFQQLRLRSSELLGLFYPVCQ
jgi:hypothetical protein